MKLKFVCRSAIVAAISLVLAWGILAQNKGDSDVDEGTKQTVEGLVRDIACPIQNHKSTSRDFNLQCALDCAKQGSPLIILTDDGKIYIPTSQQIAGQERESQAAAAGWKARKGNRACL